MMTMPPPVARANPRPRAICSDDRRDRQRLTISDRHFNPRPPFSASLH
jgi:hypothetical protein